MRTMGELLGERFYALLEQRLRDDGCSRALRALPSMREMILVTAADILKEFSQRDAVAGGIGVALFFSFTDLGVGTNVSSDDALVVGGQA